MKKRLFITLFFACSFSVFAQQQKDTTQVEQLETVELTSTRFKLNKSQTGKVVEVISSKELQKYQGSNIATLLDNLAGIEILGNQSTAGQNLTYSFRGGSNRQVVILIDGIAINNPSSIANDYDLRLIPLGQIERVEVIKGAASALYGSGAATAVINIKLKEAKGGFKTQINTSVGSNNTQDDSNLNLSNFKQSVSLSKRFNKASVYFSFDNENSSGMSAAKGIGFKDDPFNRQNVLLKSNFNPSEKLKLSTLFNYNRFTTNFDAGGFADAENLTKSEEVRFGVQGNYKYTKGDFNFRSAFNSISNNNTKTSFPSVNKGNSLTFDAFNRYQINKSTRFLVGLDVTTSIMTSFETPFGATALSRVIDQADYTLIDPYANFVYNNKNGFNFNLGARLNNHSDYGSHAVYTVNPSYNINLNDAQLKVMASYSTAYIVPTLFQLFSPNYGFFDLKPEENQTIEGGFELSYKNTTFQLTYFYRAEQNFIDFTLLDPTTFAFGYRNTAQDFYVNGLESSVSFNILSQLTFKANYTLTNVADTRIRIPKHKFNASLWYNPSNKTSLSATFNYTDKRTDNFFDLSTFTSSQVTLKSFSLVNLYANRKLSNSLSVYAQITNMFNVNYQELVGFSTRGRNFLLGFKLDL
ncbi:MAG: TonB-dependent receptor [Flavobacteriaceae bacterium]